ncbi:hypothetical protein AMTRI_Chr07g24190 [Amborella trichopoda]
MEARNQILQHLQASTATTSTLFMVDLVLRGIAFSTTLAAAVVMGRDKETEGLFIAKFSFSPAFSFFVAVNGAGCFYSMLSLVILSFQASQALSLRMRLVFISLDVVLMGSLIGGASAATAIAYVGRKGNKHANWLPICKLFSRFCDHVAGALLVSYVGALCFLLLVLTSAVTLNIFLMQASEGKS